MKSCFFTGHRSFSAKDDPEAIKNLMALLTILAENGVTDFYSGGYYGWDMNCEYAVFYLQRNYPQVKLHLVLPCYPEMYTSDWNKINKIPYDIILENADSIETVSENCDDDCIKKQNARLAELGDVCVCYCDRSVQQSNSVQAVNMAEKENKIIFNMYFSKKKNAV